MTIDVDPIEEPLPRYVTGMRCFAFNVTVDGKQRRAEMRVPDELLIEPHWSDAIAWVSQYVKQGNCGGCGG